MAVPRSELREPVTDFYDTCPPELLPGRYGEKVEEWVQLSDLVVLSQVRNAPNPEKERISDDLKETGELINQIDVAKLDRAAFEEYVAFVNFVYKENIVPGDFPPAANGYTYLVVAGHTRTEAMLDNERQKAEQRAELGLPEPEEGALGWTKVKIKENATPDDILALQIRENVYKEPPKERSAMAIVEGYLYGLQLGKWSNKAEFLRAKKNQYSRSTLNDALHFVELPSHIRDFVLAGGLPYRAGVELGRTLPVFREYALLKYFDGKAEHELAEEELDQYANGVLEWLGAEVAAIQHARQKGSFGGAVIKGRYENYRKDFEGYIKQAKGEEETEQISFMMQDTMADWKNRRRQIRDQYRMVVKELAQRPLGQLATVMSLHLDLLGRTDSDPILQEVAESVDKHFVQVLNQKNIPVPGAKLRLVVPGAESDESALAMSLAD